MVIWSSRLDCFQTVSTPPLKCHRLTNLRSEEDTLGCVEASGILNQAIIFANTRELSNEAELLRDIFSGCLTIDPSARLSIVTLCKILAPLNLKESFPSFRMNTENRFNPENDHVASPKEIIQAQFARKKALDVFDVSGVQYFPMKAFAVNLA